MSDEPLACPQCGEGPDGCNWAAAWETDQEREQRNQSEARVK
jgi:hypothetical protein